MLYISNQWSNSGTMSSVIKSAPKILTENFHIIVRNNICMKRLKYKKQHLKDETKSNNVLLKFLTKVEKQKTHCTKIKIQLKRKKKKNEKEKKMTCC